MSSKYNVPLTERHNEESNISIKVMVIQKLCPGKNLHNDSWLPDELSDEEMESVRDSLRQLMPMDTIVTDMWDWDIHFGNITFEDNFFNIAFDSEDDVSDHAEFLTEDILTWIDEYGIDYAQEQWDDDEFDKWVYSQCVDFINRWRANIATLFL